MEIKLEIKITPSGKKWAFLPINNNDIFIRNWEEIDDIKHDCHFYIITDTSYKNESFELPGLPYKIPGRKVYGGNGGFDLSKPNISRMVNHPKSRLDKYWEENKENWIAIAVGHGMTKSEAEAYEALFLHENNELLTKRGEEWNRIGLINIREEKSNYENKTKKLIKQEIWKSH
jgi:hypothetical protein